MKTNHVIISINAERAFEGEKIHQNLNGEMLETADLKVFTNAIRQENDIRSLKISKRK